MWYDKDISKLLFLNIFLGVIVFRNGNREEKKKLFQPMDVSFSLLLHTTKWNNTYYEAFVSW